MNKKFIIGIIVVALAGIGLAFFLFRHEEPAGNPPITQKDLNEQFGRRAANEGRTNVESQAVLVPIDMSHPLRLAIGGLGLADEDQNSQLGDLVTAGLTGERGFDLVERQSLAAILQEQKLSWSGFVRAKDAVRVGKLLKADWFLLGTEAKINGTNSIVVRVVDARTGIMRDAGVFPADQPSTKLAADLAAFMRQSRQSAASPKLRVYLAIGAFEDLGVNNRQADFPTQLRGYLTAAYRNSNVTLLEREYVETLLQEVHLDMAGLTEDTGPNPPTAMQSAYWVASGEYQSYETTNLQVEVKLDVRRVFGKHWQSTIRGLPGEPIGRQVKSSVDELLTQNSGALVPNRVSEARVQMQIGQALMGLNERSHGDTMLVYVDENPPGQILIDKDWKIDQALAAQQKRKSEEAIRAFQTVLLLQPTNRAAKMHLAACLRNTAINRIEDACRYYRELIDEPPRDSWTELAKSALTQTLFSASPEEKLREFQTAAAQTTNLTTAAFYQKQAEEAGAQVSPKSGDASKAEEFAEQRILAAIRSCKNVLQGKPGNFDPQMGFEDYVDSFGPDTATAAEKVAQLIPKLKSQEPEMEPYLLATAVTFQVDPNAPVVGEFQQKLSDCVDNPGTVLNLVQFWNTIRWSVYDWCFQKTNYPLAVVLMEGEQHTASGGKVIFNDQEKIKLGFAYIATKRWQQALDVFESFSNRPVQTEGPGPWGRAFKPVLTDKEADFCRKKLGMSVASDPRMFDFGKPLAGMGALSTFLADDDGLWVGFRGALLRLDFDLKTNFVVNLPVDASVPITALYQTASKIWIGTRGGGLIEFDKTTRECRHFAEADGLLMNDIACLEATTDCLWIGYGGGTGGGLGRLDLRSQKLDSFMPSLDNDSSARNSGTPPRKAIDRIVANPAGDLWLLVGETLRQFHVAQGSWESSPNENGVWVTCFAADPDRLIEGLSIGLSEIEISTGDSRTASTNEIHKSKLIVSYAEEQRIREEIKTNANHQWISASSVGRTRPKGALAIQNFHDHSWQNLEDADALPNPPSTLTINGNDLWVGGEGSIALVDLKEGKVRKYCHVKADAVDRIQIAGGYVWAQFDWHLYRVPLSALQ